MLKEKIVMYKKKKLVHVSTLIFCFLFFVFLGWLAKTAFAWRLLPVCPRCGGALPPCYPGP